MSEKYDDEDLIDEYKPITYISSTGLKWEELQEEISGFIFSGKKSELTGSIEEIKSSKFMKYPFDRYIVTVELSPNNEFLGITEIQLNKDFRDYKAKKHSQISLNIEEFYSEE